jgi:hypothetical protein
MKELTTDEMSSLKGGQFNIAALVSVNSVAAAVPVAINGGAQAATQIAAAAAGNQAAGISQLANSGVINP